MKIKTLPTLSLKRMHTTVVFPIIFLPCSCSGEYAYSKAMQEKQPSKVHSFIKSSVYSILWYFHQTFQLTSDEVSLKGLVQVPPN